MRAEPSGGRGIQIGVPLVGEGSRLECAICCKCSLRSYEDIIIPLSNEGKGRDRPWDSTET